MRNRYFLLLDVPAIAVAAYGAFVLRFDWLFVHQRREFIAYVVAAMVMKPLVFYVFGIYARYWQYASIEDMTAVFLAVSASSVVMAVVVGLEGLAGVASGFSRSIVFVDWLLTLVLIGMIRLSIRAISDQRSRTPKGSSRGDAETSGRRILVVGAGIAGSMVVREMHRNPHLEMTPVGYLDDDRGKIGARIHGVRVLGDTKSLSEVVKSQRVDEVLIAMPRAPGLVVRAVAEDCRRHGVASRIVPGVFELLDGHVSISRVRKVEIADLLRRPQIVGRADSVSYLEGRTVLITGAGGSIGGELSRQVAFSRPKQLVLLGHGENSIFSVHSSLRVQYPGLRLHPVVADVRDAARLNAVFGRFNPDVVFHAAAHKHVTLMEANPGEAMTNNVLGTQTVVEAALACGSERLVFISSDKAVSPSNFMGASKRIAEMIVREAATRSGRAFVVVRFGNVLGSRGSVVPIFKEQIERAGPVTVTHPDMKRFFMTIPEAVHLVLEAGGMGDGGELFVLNMGEQVRIVDLANDLIRLSGLTPEEIPIVFSGVRPGEKIEEQLWETGADVASTSNPEVLKVTESEEHLQAGLAELIRSLAVAAEREDRFAIETTLAQAISTFVPARAKED